jgi:RNA polymerase primary sigma factor
MSNNLQAFFKNIGQNKILTKEEEIDLSKKIESGDMKARDLMIRSNIKLAISLAKKHSRKGFQFEDLIQESSIGLIKAVDRFDWRKGYKFSTYACWWINQSIQEYIASYSTVIRLPNHAKNTIYKMNEIINDYKNEFGLEPSLQEVAEALNTTPETLQSIIQCSSKSISLDAQIPGADENSSRPLHELLPDENAETVEEKISKQELIDTLTEVLNKLTPREEAVLRMRFGIKHSKGSKNANA